MWDLIVSIPDNCLSFYFAYQSSCGCALWWPLKVTPYIHLMLLFQPQRLFAMTFQGKELFIRFTASAFLKLMSVYVFSCFPFGFKGRMWDLIVSVPDHCLFFTFLIR